MGLPMEPMEDRIWAYGELRPEEQAVVDAYVRRHPGLQAHLDRAKALYGLVEAARVLGEEPVRDEALAFYAASRLYAAYPPPEPLRTRFARIEQALREDAALQARYELLQHRLRELEAQSDPVAQFERLAGYRLDAPAARGPDAPPGPRAPDRDLVRGPSLYRWAVAASVALVALYGVLFFAGRAGQPYPQRLAWQDRAEAGWEQLRLRGEEPAGEAEVLPESFLRQGLASLQAARATTIGLFPRYDQARLAEAVQAFEQVIRLEGPSTYLALEARYYLGVARLAQRDVAGARAAFTEVIGREGGKAPEARALLAALAQTGE